MFIIAGNNFCLKHGLMNKGKGHYKLRTVVSKSEVSYCLKKWRYFNTFVEKRFFKKIGYQFLPSSRSLILKLIHVVFFKMSAFWFVF